MNFQDIPMRASVFVDANTFIYHFISEPTFGAASTALLRRLETREIEGYTTPHIVAEAAHRLMTIEACSVFGWPYAGIASRLRRRRQEIAKLTRFQQALSEIGRLDLKVIEVKADDVFRAAEISRQYGLLTNDAVAVAVIQRCGLRNLASNDDDFDAVPGLVRFAPV